MSASDQRKNNPLKWIQRFYPRTYSSLLRGGSRDQIGLITRVHRVRFQSVAPRYRLSMPKKNDKQVGSVFGEPIASCASINHLITETNQTSRIVPGKIPEGKKPNKETKRQTVARSTTRSVRIGKFEVVNDIGFEPPAFVNKNA